MVSLVILEKKKALMNFRGFINLMYGKMTREKCCVEKKPNCMSLNEYVRKYKYWLKRKYKDGQH